MRNKGVNKYDTYIIILLSSMFLGGLGGPISVTRLLTIVFLPLLVNTFDKCHFLKRSIFYISFIILYLIVSFVWSIDIVQGAKEVVYYFVHFLLYLEILVFANLSNYPCKSIVRGWMLAFALTIPIALWELITDNHISGGLEGMDTGFTAYIDGLPVEHRFAKIAFGNYNSYCTYICYCIPFVLYYTRSLGKKVTGFSLIFFAFVITIVNASRGAFLTLVIILSIYFHMAVKGFAKIWLILIITAICSVAIYSLKDSLLAIFLMRISDGGLTNGDTRFGIWNCAWNVFLNSNGLGVGIGSLEKAMLLENANEIPNPHNLFLELLAQYGMLISLFFLAYCIMMLVQTRKVAFDRKVILYCALLSFPFSSIIDSGYLLHPKLFSFFASLQIFAYGDYYNNRMNV